MKYILIFIIVIGLLAYLFLNKISKTDPVKNEKTLQAETQPTIEKIKSENDTLTYSEKLNKAKEYYPFEKWRENFIEYEMMQYTEENCNAAKNIFDSLINKLNESGKNGNEQTKVKYFEYAIKALNELNSKDESLIETGEREDLCELIDQITIAANLNPEDYGDGEGISDEWRDW